MTEKWKSRQNIIRANVGFYIIFILIMFFSIFLKILQRHVLFVYSEGKQVFEELSLSDKNAKIFFQYYSYARDKVLFKG